MSGIAVARLGEERKLWRKDHPADFYARPSKKDDNSTNNVCIIIYVYKSALLFKINNKHNLISWFLFFFICISVSLYMCL